jgi:hypothetical protein
MKKVINMRSINCVVFCLFIGLLLIDRSISLIHFGFVYTDIDQLILWNGAIDYSNGLFYEPFFYGQAYNYMLEAVIAVPLIRLNVPVFIALPIASSIIALLPFMVLGLVLFVKQKHFWAYLSLAIPVLLPLQFNLLTMISRGFVQAHLFIPLLFIPLFFPQDKRSVTILFLASSLCFVANQSSILIALPIIVYVASFHFRSPTFYLKSLWLIPALLLDFLLKSFYKIHPERVLHTISGIRLDGSTFIKSIGNISLFEFLHPFNDYGGLVYLLVLLSLALVAWRKALKKELVFMISAICIILISLAIPKVHIAYPLDGAGMFFSSSRFYQTLPLLVIISAYLIFRNNDLKRYSIYLLLGVCLWSFFIKNSEIQRKVDETIAGTSFPTARNQELLDRAERMKTLSSELDLDLIVYNELASSGWSNIFDCYALHPLTAGDTRTIGGLNSVCLRGDRRSWLYKDSEYCERILLVGFNVDDEAMKSFEFAIVDDNYLLINSSRLSTKSLFERLGYEFGPQGNH